MVLLARAFAGGDDPEGAEDDLEVAGEGAAADVLQVVLHRLVVTQVGTAAHLRESRDARLDVVAGVVLGRVLVDQFGDLGPGTDDAHVALEHVPEVRQFIEAGLAQKGADATVTLKKETLDNIELKTTTVDEAIASGDMKIDGSKANFDEFFGLLDTFPFWFNIVTP